MRNSLFLKIGFCLQRRNGEDIPVAQTKNINHRRFAASFRLQEVTKTYQDLYRCVTQSERGSGVSNFAQLIVRGNTFCFMKLHAFIWTEKVCRQSDWFVNHCILHCKLLFCIISKILIMSVKVEPSFKIDQLLVQPLSYHMKFDSATFNVMKHILYFLPYHLIIFILTSKMFPLVWDILKVQLQDFIPRSVVTTRSQEILQVEQ